MLTHRGSVPTAKDETLGLASFGEDMRRRVGTQHTAPDHACPVPANSPS